MVKLQSTFAEDTIKMTKSAISFELEPFSDLDCRVQSQRFVRTTLKDDFNLSKTKTSKGSFYLKLHPSKSKLFGKGYLRPLEDRRTDTYFQSDDRRTQLENYYEECNKYIVAPLEAVKKCLEENDANKKEMHLNLQNYGVNSLEIYLIGQMLIGPPVVSITHLNLSNCSFDDIGCIALSELLQQSSTLTHLNLSGCPLGMRGAEVLCDGIELSQSLVDLDLSKCKLTDIGGSVVMKALLFNEHIKRLNLSDNNFAGRTSTEFANLLKQNKILEDINLMWNDLFFELVSGVPIFKALRQNENLRKLNLAWNGISGKAFATFLFRALKENKFLKVLNLENNRISEIELPYILRTIKSTTSLEELYLGGNILSGANVHDLIKCLTGNISLKLLHLGEDIWIPENSFLLAEQIMTQRPEIKIIFKGKILPNPPDAVDFKTIIIDRAKYLAMAPKKKKLKRDLGHFMRDAMDAERSYYRQDSFEDLLKKFKAKLDPNLIGHLSTEFTEKISVCKKSAKRVLTKDMAKFYLERHPTERPPLTSQKKKRGKKSKKKRNDGSAGRIKGEAKMQRKNTGQTGQKRITTRKIGKKSDDKRRK